jgi:hypothetical protein
MSLCYDFQKWTIISLLSVAISLTVGLILLVGKAYGQTQTYAYDGEPKWGDVLIKKCVLYNSTYFYMLVSNSTDCGEIVQWYDSHNWQFVTETDGKIVLLFGNNMTAKEKAFEEGKKENK